MVVKGRSVLAAHCPLCGKEHRYDKGVPGGPESTEIVALGFSDEWLPCQYDLPGNFWRVLLLPTRRRRPPQPGDRLQPPERAADGERNAGPPR